MGTSLWFAGNAILPQLDQRLSLGEDAVGYMTSSVQLGFILGTLLFAFLTLSDRYSPRVVFFLCSLAGAASNTGIWFYSESFPLILSFRFLTGFFLAGIYPVGMKIASGWYDHSLGKAIGFLVGALVLGTSLPHFLNSSHQTFSWESVLLLVSGVAALGGLLMLMFVPDGPHLSKGTTFSPTALGTIFSSRKFRASAFGYFGHMWELYAFWAFVPVTLKFAGAADAGFNISFWSFWIIAAGSVGCIVGGLVSQKTGSAKVAAIQLTASGICCLVSPIAYFLPFQLYVSFLVFWGIVVVGDSPQFSTLNAQNAPKKLVGSALTIVNSIGFAITIVSIQMLASLAPVIPPNCLLFPLAIGPLLGVITMKPLLEKPR
ncbi:MAG: nitrate/nitrite transporter [Nitrospinota bacterium]